MTILSLQVLKYLRFGSRDKDFFTICTKIVPQVVGVGLLLQARDNQHLDKKTILASKTKLCHLGKNRKN